MVLLRNLNFIVPNSFSMLFTITFFSEIQDIKTSYIQIGRLYWLKGLAVLIYKKLKYSNTDLGNEFDK